MRLGVGYWAPEAQPVRLAMGQEIGPSPTKTVYCFVFVNLAIHVSSSFVGLVDPELAESSALNSSEDWSGGSGGRFSYRLTMAVFRRSFSLQSILLYILFLFLSTAPLYFYMLVLDSYTLFLAEDSWSFWLSSAPASFDTASDQLSYALACVHFLVLPKLIPSRGAFETCKEAPLICTCLCRLDADDLTSTS